MADKKYAGVETEGVTNFGAAFKAGRESGGVMFIKEGDITPLALIPSHLEVTSLEKYLEAPRRIEASPKFADADSFCQYILAFKDAGSRIFAEIKKEKDTVTYGFEAVLDYHRAKGGGDTGENTARWGDHTASYPCPLSEEWMTWMGKNEIGMSHKDFVVFIEKNLMDISSPPQARMLEAIRDLKMIRTEKFESAQDTRTGEVQFEYRQTAADAAKGHVDIPAGFEISVPVFCDSPTALSPRYTVAVKIRFVMTEGKLSLSYELVRPHKVVDRAFGNIFKSIQEKTGINILITC